MLPYLEDMIRLYRYCYNMELTLMPRVDIIAIHYRLPYLEGMIRLYKYCCNIELMLIPRIESMAVH